MGAVASALARRMCPPTRTKAVGSTPYGNPLPPALHVTLSSAPGGGLRADGRIIVVGDVHGCSKELEALLSKVKFLKGGDNLLLVGDLVGKGPDPRGVLRTVRDSGGLSVRGNHDDAALTAAAIAARRPDAGPPAKHAWVAAPAGGGPDPDLEDLAALPFSLLIPAIGVAVVHAGLVPGVPLVRQPLAALYKMRDLKPAAGGSGWQWIEKPGLETDSVAWGSLWEGPYHVLFGHDAKRKLQLHTYATGLDTGCVYGKKLTAAVLPPPAAAAPAAQAALAAGRAPTFGELGGQLVHVEAAEVYDDKGKEGKAAKEERAGKGAAKEEGVDGEASAAAQGGGGGGGGKEGKKPRKKR